jgi:hypothetical protein
MTMPNLYFVFKNLCPKSKDLTLKSIRQILRQAQNWSLSGSFGILKNSPNG